MPRRFQLHLKDGGLLRKQRASAIRAVTLDVGGTLIEPWPSVGHVYAEIADRHGIPGLAPEDLTGRFARAWRKAENFRYRRLDWAALVDATFLDLTPRPPSRTFFRELYERFTEPNAWRIFDDVLPALERLRSYGIQLGVISNWDTRLEPLLENLGLQGFFDVVVVSCHVRSCKPERRIFRSAARRLGISPTNILHVGDNWEMDVLGARRAGFRALQLDRARPSGRGRIRSLVELCR
jgi:putative hydrolase of the HAD superfamily